MKTITKNQIIKAGEYIKKNCRPLEKARFGYLFEGNNIPGAIVEELKKFQNPDGGFGHSLESDFLLPDSSPMATTIAFQFLEEISDPNDEVIEDSWGNPTAEIIGYLNKYKTFITTLDLDVLTENTISYWKNRREFPSEHEVYCFIRLYNHLPLDKAKRLEKKIKEATEKLVCLDYKKWNTYVPQPLQFENFAKSGIEKNLDYLVTTIGENGVWSPNWIWHQYEDVWLEQKIKWEGVLTIHNLGILKRHNRIE